MYDTSVPQTSEDRGQKFGKLIVTATRSFLDSSDDVTSLNFTKSKIRPSWFIHAICLDYLIGEGLEKRTLQ